MKTALIFHPDYLLHEPGSGHPERPARLESIISHLKRQGLLDSLLNVAPQPADEAWLRQVHTEAHLETLQKAASEAPMYLDPDTGLSEESYRVAKLAAGGALQAVDLVMAGDVENAFAALRPPGHHAVPDRAMGFCLINNVAVAARYAQKKYGVERALIIDWDVHHGNGTQDTFYTDPTVFYFSTHQWPYYPGSGAANETGSGAGMGTTLNAPLSAGAGNADILQAFEHELVPAADAFRPDFIFISAGFDAHRDDPLAGLRVTEAGFGELTRIVMEIAAKHSGGRLVSLLEGGYELTALALSVEAHLRQLAGIEAGD